MSRRRAFKIGEPGGLSLWPSHLSCRTRRSSSFATARRASPWPARSARIWAARWRYFRAIRQFHCPCHGSVFGADGTVQHGPAPRALDWFEVTQARDGQLRVDKDKVVPPNYRLMV